MTLPSVRGRGARQRWALGASLGVMLGAAAAVSADEIQAPDMVRPPAAAAPANVRTADNIMQSQPAPAVLPLRPTQPDGEPSNQRVLMLMLLGGAAGSAGPFGRLGQ